MQTEHYMANMAKPGRTEPPGLVGLERVDDGAGHERLEVAVPLDPAAGRSVRAGAVAGASQGCSPLGSRDDEAQPA